MGFIYFLFHCFGPKCHIGMLIHNVPLHTQEALSLPELCQAGKNVEKDTIGKNQIQLILFRLDYMLWPWFERVASYGSVYQVNLIFSFNRQPFLNLAFIG